MIALHALDWPDMRRLMTVPGVNLIVAATFLAAVGDIRRFPTARQLVGYLGLDPKVRQSGNGPPRTAGSPSRAPARPATRSSKRLERGPRPRPAARLLPARPRAPRPSDRDRRHRAQTRVPVLVHALPRPGLRLRPTSLTRKKLRRLEITAGAPRSRASPASGPPTPRCAKPNATSPTRPNCLQAHRPRLAATRRRRARARHRGTHLKGPRRAKPRGRPQAPDVCASLRQSLAPHSVSHQEHQRPAT